MRYIRYMLLGHSFVLRPYRLVLGTAGSVLTIGFSINKRILAMEKKNSLIREN